MHRRRKLKDRVGMAMLIDRAQMESLIQDLKRCLSMDECESAVLIMDPNTREYFERKQEEAEIEAIDAETVSLTEVPMPPQLGADTLYTIGLPLTPDEFMQAIAER